MTVKELIEKLQKMPQDKEIFFKHIYYSDIYEHLNGQGNESLIEINDVSIDTKDDCIVCSENS